MYVVVAKIMVASQCLHWVALDLYLWITKITKLLIRPIKNSNNKPPVAMKASKQYLPMLINPSLSRYWKWTNTRQASEKYFGPFKKLYSTDNFVKKYLQVHNLVPREIKENPGNEVAGSRLLSTAFFAKKYRYHSTFFRGQNHFLPGVRAVFNHWHSFQLPYLGQLWDVLKRLMFWY